MAKLEGKCPWCGGNMFTEDGVSKCLMCAREIKHLKDRHRYFEANKEAIMADVARLGRGKSLDKWKISAGSISKLLRRWRESAAPKQPVPDPQPSRNGIPPLPVFSNDWQPSVQIAWLNLYRELTLESKQEV